MLKNKHYILLMFLYFFIHSDLLYSESLSGEQIMERVYERENGDDVSATIRFTIIDEDGKVKVRNTKRIWIDLDGKVGFSEKTMFFFLSPPELKDTSFLTWNYEKYGKDDDQWIYLPSLRKTRRIASSSKNDSFFGTDFTYADLNIRDLEEDDHTLLKIDGFQDKEFYVIESIPKDKKDAYSKIVSRVDKQNWTISIIEYYDRTGRHSKTQLLEWELMKGIWTSVNLVMDNHLTGNKTTVTVKNIQYNSGLKEKMFHERTLKRGIR